MSEKLKQITGEFAAAFTTKTRDNGDTFYLLKDGSPEWMTEIVHAAHADMGPDDWRYKMISEVADRLEDIDPEEWDDRASEECDGLVDIYNGPRLQWLASRLDRAGYCDEAREEGLVAEDADMFTRIGIGMFQEYQEIWYAVAQALRERGEETVKGAILRGEDK